MSDELIALDPRFAPEHALYYLEGLRAHVGEQLPFTREGFPQSYTDQQPLAFVLRRGGRHRKVYLSAGDKPDLDSAALEWADVYGKVNLDPDLVPPAHADKVVPIGPSHAVRLWDLPTSAGIALQTFRGGGRIVSTREHFRRYWIAYSRRVGSEQYDPAPSQEGYVFYNSWLWAKHADVNPPRAEFIKACRELAARGTIRFEGGFIARRRGDMPEYDTLTAPESYALPRYLENIKRSMVVFNTPAVHRCLGWKLGEFLRLGKAIISLPLSRQMPTPLEHGTHIHIVDGSTESIASAVVQLLEDSSYRRNLEEATRAYWLDYLAPRVVIQRLADAAFEQAEAT